MRDRDRMILPPEPSKRELREKLAQDVQGVLVQQIPEGETRSKRAPNPFAKKAYWGRNHGTTRRFKESYEPRPGIPSAPVFRDHITEEKAYLEMRHATSIGEKYRRRTKT